MRSAICAIIGVLGATAGCKSPEPDKPTFTILGDALFDSGRVTAIAARGETLAIRIAHDEPGSVTLTVDGGGVVVHGYAIGNVRVVRPSTEMYGGSLGAGPYPDSIDAESAAPTTDPAYYEIFVPPDTAPGVHTGELVVAGHKLPFELTIAPVTMPRIDTSPAVWAFHQALGGAQEQACADLFRQYGALLTPDLALADFPAARSKLAGMKYIPVKVATDPATIGADVRGWIAATAGTGMIPFAIPIDEPHDADARQRVRALADAARAAGAGPTTFLFAVTDVPHPEYGDAVDLYIASHAAHLAGDKVMRWTYNGKPPEAGSMVVDSPPPGLRTWGWIAWRWQIPLWYAWEATYWSDRYNARGASKPPHPLAAQRDAVSFDDGEDRGNLDGVLALPGPDDKCLPTLRLVMLRRGQQDRALLDAAAHCAPQPTAAVAARMVPRALGDAEHDHAPSWSIDGTVWEAARRELIKIASGCK